MKKLVLAGAAVAALALGGPAMAADLPVKAPPIIAPLYDWTGFYVGINGGWSWGKSDTDLTLVGFPPFSGIGNINGGLVGGQAGYNWQVNPKIVIGVEADVQKAWQSGTLQLDDGPFCVTIVGGALLRRCDTASVTLEQRLSWFGTGRLRLGFLPLPHMMLYATGGVAFGEIENNVTLSTLTVSQGPNGTTTTAALAAGSANSNRIGWVAGGGVEHALGGLWTAKLEYLFVDYGTFSNTYTLAGVPVLTTSTHLTDNIIRAGLNYRFGGPVVAKY
jgi:outer membrane immunogenic protein